MMTPKEQPDFETEVRARLGITGADFLARLRFNDLAGWPHEDIAYLIDLGKDQAHVSDEQPHS